MDIISTLLMREFNVVESANGVFTSKEIAMPVALQQNLGYVIVGVDIECEMPGDVPPGGFAYSYNVVTITKEPKVGLPTPDDEDMIARHSVQTHGNLHITAINVDDQGFSGKIVSPELGLPLLHAVLDGSIQSDNTAATANGYALIYYFIAKFTDREMRDMIFTDAYEE